VTFFLMVRSLPKAGVSNHEADALRHGFILRDASLRDAPQHEDQF
jgi:hypothetical protein